MKSALIGRRAPAMRQLLPALAPASIRQASAERERARENDRLTRYCNAGGHWVSPGLQAGLLPHAPRRTCSLTPGARTPIFSLSLPVVVAFFSGLGGSNARTHPVLFVNVFTNLYSNLRIKRNYFLRLTLLSQPSASRPAKVDTNMLFIHDCAVCTRKKPKESHPV